MATDLVNERHKAIPSIFRLPRNTAFSSAIVRSPNGTAAIFSLRCRARSTETGAAEERTEKFQLCVCSKTCDQDARNPDWRRLSFSCDYSEVTCALVSGLS